MPCRATAKISKERGCNSNSVQSTENNCYEGKQLTSLLQSIERGIESARRTDGRSLPEKIWLKQQFSIGVNDVTRVLERMKPFIELGRSAKLPSSIGGNYKAPSVKLQAVLVASDCSPRWLTKHLPSLASSRGVPLIYVKDNKQGSLRLGELVKLKTAIAIGIKEKGNSINTIFEDILQGDEYNCGSTQPNSAVTFDLERDFKDPEEKSHVQPQPVSK